MNLTFEWDEEKADKNLRKHGVSFEEAKTVFNDSFLMTYPDLEHFYNEKRHISIGCSANARILVLIHTERNENIRIISCSKATPKERRIYEQGDF
ncbi:BrnT family toxin [Desulfonema magnum]|uniref:Toxin-antitoxin system, toxin component, type II BrnT n=1 Tax=Desulfonema magnum TaxID=45655 RepID=A0A975BV35_9BACT|nr:BrnT family toxin [Desulfonema magnum]QTA92316.1 Putative toxin-antitoxin system, toxin component, type II BrnT [Desulfonema magnum]